VSERAFPRPVGYPATEERSRGCNGCEQCGYWWNSLTSPQRSEQRAAERIGAAGTTRLRVGVLRLLSYHSK
jgi:hypothetical protein